MQDLEKQLNELIACADISSANVSRAVQAYMKCFGAHHKEALEALVQRYPFLVKKLPLKPKTGTRSPMLQKELLMEFAWSVLCSLSTNASVGAASVFYY